MGIKRLRKKLYREGIGGYFTVEAALVMPIVLMCYVFIILLLCYIYERCVWEQNAYRLPVWKEYVEGYANMNSEIAEDVSKEDICRYILACLSKEEETRYLFGQEMTAEITVRGEYIKISRGFKYPQFGDKAYTIQMSAVILNPTDYLRTANGLKNKIVDDERENDDKE